MARHVVPVAVAIFLICSAAGADQVTISGDQSTVTKTDCRALATYRPAQGVEYQPGVDVNGHYVAPADLPGGFKYDLPAKVEFDVKINPLTFAQRNASGQQATAPTGQFTNTAMSIGHVVVDTKTGAATLDGKPLGDANEAYLAELCRKAGF